MIEIIVILSACVLLLLPINALGWRRLRPVIAVLALGFLLLPLIYVTTDNVNVRIRATLSSNSAAQGNEIHIEGVAFDGVPQELISLFPGNSWNWIENRLAWRVYDEGCQDIIYDQWPTAGEYQIFFQKSRWRGIAEVQIDNDIYTVDCYAPVDYGETEVLTVPGPSETSQISRLIAYAATALVLVLLCLYIPSALKFSKPAEKDPGVVFRESWSDALRILSAFFIVIIGVSSGVFKEYGLGYPSGINHMLLFTFASFAIPTFFMLTGAFLLHRDESPQNTLKKRAPSVIVPLTVLVAIAFLTTGQWFGGGIGAQVSYIYDSLFGSYNAVPRFFILLVALYILAPVFRPIFINAEKTVSWYAVCTICVLPSAIYTALALLGVGGTPLAVAMLASNVGQFILGAHLVTYKEKLAGKWVKPAIVAAIGFALAFLTRGGILLMGGLPKPTPFAAGIEATLMCGGIFVLFMALAPWLDNKTPDWLQALIKQLSSLAIGMLMIQTILISRIPTVSIGGFVLEINSRSIVSSVGIGVFYILISLAISYIISIVPVFKRVIGLDWYTAGKGDRDAK